MLAAAYEEKKLQEALCGSGHAQGILGGLRMSKALPPSSWFLLTKSLLKLLSWKSVGLGPCYVHACLSPPCLSKIL